MIQEMKIDVKGGVRFDVSKGDIVNMNGLTKMMFGLGWDVGSARTDVDGSAVLMENNKIIEEIYYGRKSSSNGSVQHSGDNLTGEGNGDDEQIHVYFDKLPSNINKVVFTTTVYTCGMTFRNVKNLFVRLVSDSGNHELLRYNVESNGEYMNHNGLIVCALVKRDSVWHFVAIGEAMTGHTVSELSCNPLFIKLVDTNALLPKAVETKSKPASTTHKHGIKSSPDKNKHNAKQEVKHEEHRNNPEKKKKKKFLGIF